MISTTEDFEVNVNIPDGVNPGELKGLLFWFPLQTFFKYYLSIIL